MTSFRVRPRFRREIRQSPETLSKNIEEQIHHQNSPFIMSSVPGVHSHIILKIPTVERHYWSPQLSLTLEEQEDGQTLVRGLYGPAPSVWTLFTFGYAVLSILSFFAFALGFSQWNLGMPAPILWVLPIVLLLFIGMYVLAQLGQKMGAAQTYKLHYFFENLLEEQIGIN